MGSSPDNSRSVRCDLSSTPRGYIYATIRELGPDIPYSRRNYRSQFPNGCLCGPSGTCRTVGLFFLLQEGTEPGHEWRPGLPLLLKALPGP